jgi:hypothetical protein
MRRHQLIAVAVALTLGATVAGCTLEPEETGDPNPSTSSEPAPDGDPGAPGAPAEAGTRPGGPGVEDGRAQLAALTIAEDRPMTGYDRDEFPHWVSVDGCSTRQLVLQRDGKDVETDEDCQPVSGEWFSPFDNEVVTSASEVDIDHMVPLANAWRSGADSWDKDTRRAFANDLEGPQLIAVTAGSNRSKGDQNPADWQPPAEEFWCVYGLAWTAVKHSYELTVTAEEHETLTEMLGTCAAG